jgi:hydrogenase-4 component B
MNYVAYAFDFWMWIPSLVVVLSLLTIPFLSAALKPVAAFVLVMITSAATTYLAVLALSGEIISVGMHIPGYAMVIHSRIDSLSALFIIIVNLTCINGALYGIGYMKTYQHMKSRSSLHWIMFVLFHVSMLWVCMVQHSIAFLVAWEIMSVSSLLLVMFEHEQHNTIKAGINYLVQMHIGVIFLSVAFIWVYFSQHSYSFYATGDFFAQHNPRWLFLLFFVGFGIKAGFIPLHTWLPQAHPAAPSHVSGVMSGVIVKMGIYGILRIICYLNSDFLRIGEALLIISVVTTVYGILNASVHRDFKKMLAFCTIENIGIIGIGIGIGLIGKGTGNNYMMFIGFAGALLHTVNHSLFKSLLFFAAGNIVQQTHSHNIEKLGGLIKKMPKTAFFFLIGAVAIAGLPPLNGFVSEFLIYSGLIDGIRLNNVSFSMLMVLAISGLAIAGGISMLTFTKTFGVVFLGNPRTALTNEPKEVSVLMRIPLVFIAILMLLIGIFPVPVLHYLIAPVIGGFFSADIPVDLDFKMANTLSTVGLSSLLVIGFAGVIYFIRNRISRKHKSISLPTWGCGYPVPNVRMQYTGKSFSKSLAKIFYFITSEKKNYREIDPNSIFPENRTHASHYPEFFENHIINRARNGIVGFMNFFTFIHNGKIQIYILYGLIFMIAVLVTTFFNLI